MTSSLLATGFTKPVALVQDPVRRNVQYVVQQEGLIKIIVDGVIQPAPFLDITAIVEPSTEQGLLGMVFAPGKSDPDTFYVNFTLQGPIMQVARYRRSLDPDLADPTSRFDIIRTPRVNGSHLSGTMKFGPDGMMYIPMGDGGGTGDPPNNAQNPNTLLGKMIRIDPRTDDFPLDAERNYHIPSDNPFVDDLPIPALKEIWSFGLRNPFKFSFDDPLLLGTGAMIIGDVGQSTWEELDYEPAGQGGNNYGWHRYEGFSQYASSPLAYGPHAKPLYVYNHSIGATVIGGHVYRGMELGPDFFGRYFFGDFSYGKLWSMYIVYDKVNKRWKGSDLREHTAEIGSFGIGQVSSIDVDSYGEIYLVNYGGWVSKVSRTNTTWVKAFTVQTGKVKHGSLRHIAIIDNNPLQLETSTPSETDVVSTYIATTNRPSPTTLSFDAVGNVPQNATGLLRLMVRRWSDNQYVQVRAEYMNSLRRRFRISGLDANDYVRPSDGRIEIRLAVTRTSPGGGPFVVSWDQVTASTQ